jgi:hypothetical protein
MRQRLRIVLRDFAPRRGDGALRGSQNHLHTGAIGSTCGTGAGKTFTTTPNPEKAGASEPRPAVMKYHEGSQPR